MTGVLKSIHRTERKFESATARFCLRHVFLGYLAVFIGMPVLILATVCACSTALMLPFAMFFGWL